MGITILISVKTRPKLQIICAGNPARRTEMKENREREFPIKIRIGSMPTCAHRKQDMAETRPSERLPKAFRSCSVALLWKSIIENVAPKESKSPWENMEKGSARISIKALAAHEETRSTQRSSSERKLTRRYVRMLREAEFAHPEMNPKSTSSKEIAKIFFFLLFINNAHSVPIVDEK